MAYLRFNRAKVVIFIVAGMLFGVQPLFALQVDTLYINSGTVVDKKLPVPCKYFNAKPQFDSIDAFVRLAIGDTLHLYVVNNDTIDHTLSMESMGGSFTIFHGQARQIVFEGRQGGIFRLRSVHEAWQLLGLATAVLVVPPNEANFIWHLRDAEGARNRSIRLGDSLDARNYQPDYFSINALRFPSTTTDTLGYVTGQVGDSLYINIINAGFMDHSIHFHGYHVILVSSNVINTQIGWDKDTFPIRPGESIRVLLVPHQPGKFPVHDHNLIAVTSGGNYPGGMIAILNIAP